MENKFFKPCVVIPNYNHAKTIAPLIRELEPYGLPCILINDGSNEVTKHIMHALAREKNAWVSVVDLPRNLGKGGAVQAGLRAAWERGFSHALQIDADHQHHLPDIPKFLQIGKAQPNVLVLGEPRFDASVPRSRLWGRQITQFLVHVQTLSKHIADPMCGFRLYPLVAVKKLLDQRKLTQRMDFDVEVAVRLDWEAVPIVNLPTPVVYPRDGLSNFRMGRDNVLIALVHIRLLLEMFYRLPRRLILKRQKLAVSESAWFKFAERGSVLGFKFLFLVYRILGRRFCQLLLYPVVVYFFLTGQKARNASRQYFERLYATPEGKKVLQSRPSLWLSFRHFLAFTFAAFDKVSAWLGDIKVKNIIWKNRPEFIAIVEKGKGGVILSAHLGNIEVIRALATQATINALMFTRHAQIFNKVLQSKQPNAGVRLVAVESLTPHIILTLKEKIRQGEFVALLGDRVTEGAPEKVVNARFLGELAPFPEGPMILASLLDCPVYTLFCLREGKEQYQVYFEELSETLSARRQERKEKIRVAVENYAQRLETYCLKAPLQWFNFYDFWKTA